MVFIMVEIIKLYVRVLEDYLVIADYYSTEFKKKVFITNTFQYFILYAAISLFFKLAVAHFHA